MNHTPLKNNFKISPDGWIHLCPVGEFRWSDGKDTILQVLDRPALESMTNNFKGEVLIDYDHESWDPGKRTTAAGWINKLEVREDGLWGQPRWSSEGARDIAGGNFRFISPTFNRADCEDLGEGKVRPLRLADCAVTNKPNLPVKPITNKQPIANKGTSEGAKKGWATRRANGWVPKGTGKSAKKKARPDSPDKAAPKTASAQPRDLDKEMFDFYGLGNRAPGWRAKTFSHKSVANPKTKPKEKQPC
jgi:hypothetical protein